MRTWQVALAMLCAACAAPEQQKPSNAESLIADCQTEPREIPGWPPIYDPVAARDVRGINLETGEPVDLSLAFLLHRSDVESCAHLASCRDALGEALRAAEQPEQQSGLRPLEWVLVGGAGGLVVGVGAAALIAWAVSR